MLVEFFRKLLFDRRCCLCGKETLDTPICKNCALKIKRKSFLKKYKNVYYLYYYDEMKQIILDFKFNNRKVVIEFLKDEIKKTIKKIIEKEKIDLVIPVPISKKRKLERGYNQVEEILKKCGIPYEKIERIKNTDYMSKLKTKSQREKNIQNSFFIDKKYLNKKILVIDDIVTTGSTFNEIEKVIKSSSEKTEIVFFALLLVKKYMKGEHKWKYILMEKKQR